MNVNGLVLSRCCGCVALAALAGVVACHSDRVLSPGRSYTLQVISGDARSAPAGSLLRDGVAVQVRDASGLPVRGTIVVFRVMRGASQGAAVSDSLVVTNDFGEAGTDLRLPAAPDTVEILAFPGGAPDRAVRLRAIATGGSTLTGVLPASVGPGDTLALAGSVLGGVSAVVEIGSARVKPISGGAGELRVVVPDCLGAGPVAVRVLNGTAWTASRTVMYTPRRRPRVLQRFESVTIGAAELGSCASFSTEDGAQYLLVPQLASQGLTPAQSIVRVSVGGATSVASLLAPAALGGSWRADVNDAQAAFDARLRDEERRLAPMAREPPVGFRPPMLALAVGSLRTFRVIADLDAQTYVNATGRLRFVGRHLAVYLDTASASAYTDEQLEKLGMLFDNDLYRTDVMAFGPESDIDRNDQVLVFLTPRVNALVAAADCGQRGFVTGFFFGRDLLPSAANSNAGEIFYAMVPDPAGRYSCSHAASDVLRLVPGTFVHEFQHMISFFHHVIARAGDPEARWLNEGLSHIAEELASRVFELRYPSPLGRSTTTQLFPDSSNGFISPQMLNAYIYLANTSTHSVTTFESSGSIEERGAAWLFLRWLADQKGEEIFQRLVQTSRTGTANIETRTGEPFARLFGDFAVAVYTDSMPGFPRDAVPPRYRFLTRNLRQLMAREATLAGFQHPFPVVPVQVPFAGYAEGPIIPGTMVYTMFGPTAAGQGPAVLNYFRPSGVPFAPADGAQLGIVRLR